jgi:NAD(P)-dependent dehydrogenase (short-subunit alcohol dehydrogenase family)
MASVLVTGSSDGIGRETAATLLRMGHRVVLHARNVGRAAEAAAAFAGTADVVVGDLASLAETKALAGAARQKGPYDVVIHNAGVGGGVRRRELTVDGLERIFQVNALAPYVLTALMDRPSRLVYLTSGLQEGGRFEPSDLQFERRPWDGMQAYSDSKLHDLMLAFAVARRWPTTLCNAVDPGWIKTRMGGAGAPDSLPLGAETQVWLATSDEPGALVTGRYFKRRQEMVANPVARDPVFQEAFLAICQSLSGVAFPPAT